MKKCIVILLFLHVICNPGKAQDGLSDTLLALKQNLNNSEEDTTRVLTLIAIANSFGVDRPDSSLFYLFKAVQLTRNIGYQKGELRALLGIEVTLRHNGNVVKAYSTAYKGLKLARIYQQPYYRAQFLGELGIIEGEFGNYGRALELLRQSRTLFDSIQENELAIYQWNNMGEVYLMQGNLDSALYYCRAAFEGQTPINFWINYYSSANLGKIYLRRQEYELALSYFRKSLTMAAFFSHKFNSSLSIATAYNFLNKRDSCIHYAERAMVIARESHIFTQLVDVNIFLASLYEVQDPGKALQFARNAISYKDSLHRFSEGLVMESFIEFDEQERQYEIKNAQAVYQFKFRQYALLASLGVLAIIAAILYRNNKQKQSANKLLYGQKEEISIQRQKAENTLNELKATQLQLIQSEKMASLGELTAGVAHEMQNPLNFVNNFSEVSTELLDEMIIELGNDNKSAAIVIADDVKQNLEKILLHGKQADGIVKSMLQHSRGSSAEKELTNINKLADEYLRLAFRGWRAKDKSFNVTMKTDFDESIDNINIVAQDIGRVILNLVNNAFYAVAEEKKQVGEDYEPIVTVTTKRVHASLKDEDKIEISVADNGIGIPSKVVGKIFQPFFTTKPPGSGTGLGLSLSYDIIKAHGGEIKVKSVVGEGAEFIITLPLT